MSSEYDVIKVAPRLHSVSFENDKIRVIKATLPPGEKLAEHWHPVNLTIVLKGSKLRIVKDGQSKVVDVPDGHVSVNEAGKHTVENIGNSTIDEYLIEFKQ